MKIPKISSLLGSAVALLAMASLSSTQASPTFNWSTPSGKVSFENSYTTITFGISDATNTPITNVSVLLTGTRLVNGATFLRYGTWPGSLSFSWLSNASSATYNKFSGLTLEKNIQYTAVITAVDALATNTTTVTFDTISPVFLWEAEDYDYTPTNADGSFVINPDGTTNSNQHFEAPSISSVYGATNAYKGRAATVYDALTYYTGTDGQNYRPLTAFGSYHTGWSTAIMTDAPRPPFNGTGYTNYSLGWSQPSSYANYTHNYPGADSYSTVYFVYARIAASFSGSNSFHLYDPSGTDRGWFGAINTGGTSTFTWVPMKEATGSGNMAQFSTALFNSPTTYSFVADSGATAWGFNVDAFMFLKASTLNKSAATIGNFTPDGTKQWQPSNTLSFTVTGGSAAAQNVVVRLYVTNLDLTTSTYTYAGQNAPLTITGTSGNLTVSLPITTNKMYGVTVQATDNAGLDATASWNFDTFKPVFVVDAENYDFNGGWYNTNGGVNSYAGYSNAAPYISITNVDFVFAGNTNAEFFYRYGECTEVVTDPVTRYDHIASDGTVLPDYDLGYNTAGNWENFTRVWPSNISANGKTNIGYNIVARTANSVSTYTDIGSLSIVTSGVGTTTQTTQAIGYYGSIQGPDFHTGTYRPVIDAGGNIAIFKGGGTVTVRNTFDGNYGNLNYFMLIPADPNVKNKPYILKFTPDGSALYQPSNTCNFNVVSQAGVGPANLTITLDGATLSTNAVTYGTNPNLLSVSFPIYTNTIHTVTVAITDAYGSTSLTSSFAAFTTNNGYKIEAEDWDFNGGQFTPFESYTVNCYSNIQPTSITNVDFGRTGNNGTLNYRYGLATESASDGLESADHTGLVNYDLGYCLTGDWCNYTRVYPKGSYCIFKRAADNSASQAMGMFSQVISGLGSTTQQTNFLGNFNLAINTGGWQTYAWFALTNSSGNLIRFTSDGSTAVTLRHVSLGGVNPDYYVIQPWNTSIPEKPAVVAFTPDGSALYQPSNTANFVTKSLDANFNPANVTAYLDGIKQSITYKAYNTSTNDGYLYYLYTFTLSPSRIHSASVTVTDKNGSATSTYNFTTYSSTNCLKIEIVDWDFNGGQFISFTNWTPDCYTDTAARVAVTNVDFYRPTVASGSSMAYRYGLASGTVSDMDSDEFKTNSAAINYVPSYNTGGDWANYTRDFPAGSYQVYVRCSTGATGYLITNAFLEVVTNGVGTTSQQTNVLGRFQTFTNTGSWGGYLWCALLDSNQNKVTFTVTNGSAPITLKWDYNWPTNTSSYENPHYMLFVPVDTATPVISGVYPNGTTQFQATNKLSFNVASSSGFVNSNITVTVNGVAVSFTATGSSTNLTISVPLTLNTNYVVTIQAIANNGSGVAQSYQFDTFDSSYYTWEAEDYDYSLGSSFGLFFNYPSICAYFGVQASEGQDFHFYGTNNDTAGVYRSSAVGPSGNYLGFANKVSGDVPRTQFPGTSATNTDYDIEYFCDSDWAHYTRNYKAGTFYVLARVREGNGPVPVYLEKVIGNTGPGETVTTLGTFFPTNQGSFSGAWQNVLLKDSTGSNLVTVTFDNSLVTLRVEASTNSPNAFPVGSMGDSINFNYFMLIPATATPPQPKIAIAQSGSTISLSFASQSGSTYVVQYKKALSDSTWTTLSSKSGTGATLTVTDTIGATTRFYRVQVTTP